MKARKTVVLAVLCLLLLVPPALSQEVVALTPGDAVRRARQTNPGILRAQAEFQAADAGLGSAWTRATPEIDLTGTYARVNEREPAEIPTPTGGSVRLGDTIDDSWSFGVEARQPLFTGGRIRSGIAGATARREAAAARLEAAERQIALETVRAFWQLVEARARVSVLDERLEVMRARREDMQNRLDQGLVTVNELLEVEMGIAELDANRASAADGRDTAADRLRSLTGVPFDTELDLSYELTDGPDVETGAVERRAVVRSAERAVAAAEGGLAVQRAGFLPQLFLTGEYTYARPNPEAFPPRNEFSDSWRIGIAGRIPLGGMPQTYFAAESARAELSRARAELSDVRSRARLELRAASRRHATSAEQVAAARAVLRRAEENERSVRTRFENGRALRTDVLDAQALRVEAEMRLIEARIARQIALHELRFALGREVL